MDKIRYNTFNNLTYCVLPPFHLLPVEYQQVEYLQSAQGSNESSTGVRIDPGIGYFADFEVDIMRTDNQGTKFLGVDSDRCLQRSGEDGKFYFSGIYGSWSSNASIRERTVVKWKSNVIYINGTSIYTFNKGFQSGTFTLFGVPGRFFTNIRIYSCKLWDSDGELVRDMYPCRRISDSVLGFYDRVTSTFYPPSGTTGSFIAGSDI